MDSIIFIDFIPYLLLVSLCGFCAYYPTKNDLGVKVIFGALLLFAALRYNVGWDYSTYSKLIEKADAAGLDFKRIEWLSRNLMLLAHYTFTQLYFIINSVIGLCCIYSVCKKYSHDVAMSLFLFLTFSLFYLMSMNIIRNFTAVLMVVYACQLFLEKRYLGYIILIFLAAGMHSSAYIGLVLPLLWVLNLSRMTNVVLFVCSFIIGVIVKEWILSLSTNSLTERMVFYVMNEESEGSGPYKYVFYIINMTFLIFWDKIVKVDIRNRFFLQLVNIGVCIWTAFSFQSTLSLRFSLFFTIWMIVLVPALIDTFSVRNQKLVKQLVMLSFAGLFFLNLYILATAYNKNLIEQASFLPYKIFFFQ